MAKSLLVALSGLLALGAIAFGVMGALGISTGQRNPVTVAEVSLRPFPGSTTIPAKPLEPAPPTAIDAGVEAPAEPVDAGQPTPKPVVDAGTPAAPAVRDAGVARPPPPPQPVGEGLLNLRASDTADVYVDGKKVGSSPIDGFKVRAGSHKVRFDCYDAAGNTTPGTAKVVTVAADGEQSVEYDCPAVE